MAFPTSFRFSLLLLLCVMLTGQIFAQDQKTYEGEGYRMTYPSSWSIDDSQTRAQAIFFFSPQDGPADNFRENVNLMVQDLTPDQATMKDYLTLSKKQFKDYNATVLELSEVPDPADGFPEAFISYTMPMGEFDLQFIARVKIKGQKAYLLTYTSTIDNFEQYLEDGKAIIESFSFM